MTGSAPGATLDTLRLRARALADTRAFFAERGVLEVDTPVLAAAGATDLHLESLFVDTRVGDSPRRLYLQTSPEGHMKRLVAAGCGPVYQLSRAFRAGERGPRHNPEFVMLEWYRPGLDHVALMDEVAALVDRLLGPAPASRETYREVFLEHASIDPFDASDEDLLACCRDAGLDRGAAAGLDRDARLDFLMGARVQPSLPGRAFVHEFPATQAAQARVRAGDPPVAERFELWIDGVEVANGYTELTDPAELARRFEGNRVERRKRGLPDVAADRHLLAALPGLPDPCAGVALGFDRLVMLAAGLDDIADAMPFPIDRA